MVWIVIHEIKNVPSPMWSHNCHYPTSFAIATDDRTRPKRYVTYSCTT